MLFLGLMFGFAGVVVILGCRLVLWIWCVWYDAILD